MAANSRVHLEIQERRVPCGPMSIDASAVCRRRVRDNFALILDRLCEECHPGGIPPELPEGYVVDEEGAVVEDPSMQEDETTKIAEALKGIVGGKKKGEKEFADVGNSKMIQDTTGVIPKR